MSKKDFFKLDNHITWYLKDYEDDKEKQKKIVERNNGQLFYIFHKEDKDEDKSNRSEAAV